MVPLDRIVACNARSANGSGDYVLYWMTANRRRYFNFALQRAVEWASELRRPLLIIEALGCHYRWASHRFSTFIVQGMLDNKRAFKGSGVAYYPYVERRSRQGKGMIHTLAAKSAVVVTDDFPAFDIPGWVDSVAGRSPALVEKVDSSCIIPFRAANRTFKTAASFRRFTEQELPSRLQAFPESDPLGKLELPRYVFPTYLRQRWPEFHPQEFNLGGTKVFGRSIDSDVGVVQTISGGTTEARRRLRSFMKDGLKTYGDRRNLLDTDAHSGLSPYLHFGHISSHEVFQAAVKAGPAAVPFVDQLVTWRELGFNMCAKENDYDRYESLPEWARKTLAKHCSDRRPVTYSQEQMEEASTHDSIWNAAQAQLRTEGTIQNYLRMLWGKKILEWSQTPEDALSIMIHLNNKYALDGRDPNSYTGIFWVLGRYDRPWGPERPIFGLIRYMSSESARRKLGVEQVRRFLARYQRLE